MTQAIENLTGASIRVDPEAGWLYTGKEFILWQLAHLIHEFHHWWVSTEDERQQENFGLDEWTSPERTHQQEKQAIELDIALARACGVPEVVLWGLADYDADFPYRIMRAPKSLPYPKEVQEELKAILLESVADRKSWEWFLSNYEYDVPPGTYPPIVGLQTELEALGVW